MTIERPIAASHTSRIGHGNKSRTIPKTSIAVVNMPRTTQMATQRESNFDPKNSGSPNINQTHGSTMKIMSP